MGTTLSFSNKEGNPGTPEKAQSGFVLCYLLRNQDIICMDLMASSGTKQLLLKASMYLRLSNLDGHLRGL
jgi:hypothetical protein